jgi:hypothetical protein
MQHPHHASLTQHTGRATEDETGHENLGPYLLRVVWPLAALSTLFLGLRAYCKLSRRHRLWWDDYILIASWVRTRTVGTVLHFSHNGQALTRYL